MDTNSSQNSAPYYLNKYTLLADVARDCPRAAELLAEYGLHCVSCFANEADTLEQGAYVHYLTQEELDEMVDEINGQLEKEWKAQKDQNANLKDQRQAQK